MGAEHLRYRLAQWLSERLPSPDAFRCAEQLSDAWGRISAKDRAAVQANLSIVRGEPITEQSPDVHEVFRNFGRYLVDFFTIHRVPRPDVHVEGYEHLQEAQRGHGGVIMLTAHVGNWEIGGMLLTRMGFPVSVVALPHADAGTDRLFNQQRLRCGLHVIPVGSDAARRSLQSLRAGHLLGLIGDREFSHHGIAQTLFGRTVTLPRGPAALSLRSHAPVVPTFLTREGMWKFRLSFEPPIPPPAQRAPQAIAALTTAYATVFERYLRRFPTQWLMFQPATQPSG